MESIAGMLAEIEKLWRDSQLDAGAGLIEALTALAAELEKRAHAEQSRQIDKGFNYVLF